MASYDAIINLRLKGLNQLKEVERAVNGITGKTRTGRARTGASSVVQKELSAEQERLKTLGQIIKLKRIELGLNRQAGKAAQILNQNRTNPRLLPSTSMLGKRIAKTGQVGGVTRLKTSSQITAKFEERIAQARERSNQRNSQLLGSEKLRNAQLIKTNTAVQKAGENLIKLSNSFGKLSVSAGNLLPQTRTSSGKMLALPSSEMLDQRVRGSGQFGGFSRALRGKSFRQRIGATRGFDTQSALISGAFPLLFGQGPIGAAAGALGGGIGGMFGQMGGFAGGIAATALVQQIQTAITAISDLGKALGPFTQNTEAVVNSLGLQNTVQEAQIRLIEQVEGKTAAFNAAMKLMANDIGQRGVDALKQFGESSRILSSQFTLAITKLQAFAAGVANFVLRITGLEQSLRKADAARVVESSAIGGNTEALGLIQRQKQIDKMGSRGGEGKRKDTLQEELDLDKQLFAARQSAVTQAKLLNEESTSLIQRLQDEVNLRNRVEQLMKEGNSKTLAEKLAKNEQIFEKERQNMELLMERHQRDIDFLNQKGELNDTEQQKLDETVAKRDAINKLLQDYNNGLITAQELTKQLNTATDEYKVTLDEVKDVLASGMTDAVMGLIDGTRTLSESLAGIAKQLARMFLNRAFSSMLDTIFPSQAQGAYNRAGGFKAFQYGGVVNSPTLGMIGEGGEPEYVIPASKMSGAMARYSAGARGGAVIPGGSHESGTVAGGSGNTVVQYTGPVLNFNGDDYVPKSAVPDIINTAAKRGGEAGQAKAFATLKNSRSQRATLGL